MDDRYKLNAYALIYAICSSRKISAQEALQRFNLLPHQPQYIFTEQQMDEIRLLHMQHVRYKEIARRYNVPYMCIYRMFNKRKKRKIKEV